MNRSQKKTLRILVAVLVILVAVLLIVLGVKHYSAQKAEEEGFAAVGRHFRQIAAVEKTHAQRFQLFAQQLREGKLFVSDVETGWICLNCGHIHQGKQAPAKCPVCDHDQGYFIRLSLSPWHQ